VAVISLECVTLVLGEVLGEQFGLRFTPSLPSATQLLYLLMILTGAVLLSLIPGLAAYRQALHQSLV
jgi:ABC-type lipoprotein release transport system permease subunit